MTSVEVVWKVVKQKSIWWDMEGFLHYEFLDIDQTINNDLHCNQLDGLKRVIEDKHSSLINRQWILFHHDNARPHIE